VLAWQYIVLFDNLKGSKSAGCHVISFVTLLLKFLNAMVL